MTSHGATYNAVPLRATELTLGDYLRPLGYRVALVGKTHMKGDDAGMRRLGLDPNSSLRSEEHTSELQSLMRISYAVFCLQKKKKHTRILNTTTHKQTQA